MAAAVHSYPTQQQKNGMKLQLLRDKSEECQRKKFHQKFSRDPKTLYGELQQHQQTFQKLLKKKVLKKDQYDLLFPVSGKTNSTVFDSTLLFLLLRTVCGYQEPQTGWNGEPNVNNRSEIANLIRLKIGRNKIQHNPLPITTVEYKQIYQYPRQPLLDLGCPPQEIDNLMASFKYDVLPAEPNFVGMKKELQSIHQTLTVNSVTRSLGAVLSGIPGIGKTELGRKYCKDFGHHFDHIIWVNAESQIESTFQNIGQLLHLKVKDKNNGFKDTKFISKLIEEYFKNEKVLFVFDNCTKIESLSDVLFADHYNIITSQIKSWSGEFSVLSLDAWSWQNARKFLDRHIQSKDGQKDTLIKKLENHPLGLHHAVAFMKEADISIEEYLELLSKYTMDVLSERVALNAGMPKSVFSSFLFTIEKIKVKHPKTYELLSVIGILEGSFMDERFLERCFDNRIEFVKSKRNLLNYSIIKSHKKLNENLSYFSVHSLYQKAIQFNQMKLRSWKGVLDQFFQMMTVCKNNENFMLEQKIWFRQFQHLWNQDHLKKHILGKIVYEQHFIYICLQSTGKGSLIKDIWNELYRIWKDEKANVILYWIKFLKTQLDPIQITSIFFGAILNDVIINVADCPEKDLLLEQINLRIEFTSLYERGDLDSVTHSNETNSPIRWVVLLNKLMEEGFFKEALAVISNDETVAQCIIVKGECYMGLKEYGKALEMFGKLNENYQDDQVIIKVQIGCCYILRGDIKKGLRIVTSVEGLEEDRNSLLDVGRALFDVGLYEDAKAYFIKYVNAEIKPYDMNIYKCLDGFSKMAILHIGGIEHLLTFIKCLKDRSFLRSHIFLCCCYIRTGRVYEAFLLSEILLARQKQQQQQHEKIWFREALFIAEQLMKRNEYYQASVIYRIIRLFQNELKIPKQTLNQVEVDVNKQFQICLKRLSRIFSI